ncbi:hypothetical protein T06_5812 [Trichinella sp. T6]|nr:hypothetical protein T06_5812 [Trichinella sp. T6]
MCAYLHLLSQSDNDAMRIIFYRYESIVLIFGEKIFSRKLQNFMGYRLCCFCKNRFWSAGVEEMGSKCEVLLDIAFLEFALACAEPSFNEMKYRKRYFGNTMTEFRLNGLAEINLTDDSRLGCTTVCFNVQGNNYNAVRQTVAVRNQGAIARCYIQVKI